MISEFEVSFLRLLQKITDGSRVKLSETGTTLYYHPGLLVGGEQSHTCNSQRGIAYYLEGIMALAPFCKHPLSLTLEGATNNPEGNSS